jgi:hypothetical protein
MLSFSANPAQRRTKLNKTEIDPTPSGARSGSLLEEKYRISFECTFRDSLPIISYLMGNANYLWMKVESVDDSSFRFEGEVADLGGMILNLDATIRPNRRQSSSSPRSK